MSVCVIPDCSGDAVEHLPAGGICANHVALCEQLEAAGMPGDDCPVCQVIA